MKAISKYNKWANAHTSFAFDMLRFLLGGFLFYKGLFLLGNNSVETFKMLKFMPELGGNLILIHYVVLAQICGGIFIVFGFLTRISVLAQLPILLAAILVNVLDPINVMGLTEALFCFISAVFFAFYGSGKHSMDYAMQLNM